MVADGEGPSGGGVGGELSPVTPNGLALTYLDSTGIVTGDPASVRLIDVRVRAATVEPIRDAGGRLSQPVDSLVTLVALRNNRRT